ncbi:hypothetical protein [Nocardia sp. NPDC057668]|uniref:hypothetical protein n=1 Tax=Nocardia sp. NPDC057668 TaxID=3346202 RepID=UPI00366FEA8D
MNERTATRDTGRDRTLGGTVRVVTALAASCLLLTGCDAAVGIPGDETTAAPRPSGTATTPGPAAVPEPGSPVAAGAAVARWAADLRGRGTAGLAADCWAMAPDRIESEYAEPGPILEALTRDPVDHGDTTRWTSATVTLVVTDADTVDGYACPYVFPAGAAVEFTEADAIHTVRRFLARMIGDPVHTGDVENAYPLVCSTDTATWDPYGTGRPGIAPMAAAASKLPGIKKFADRSIRAEWPRDGYLTVTAGVTSTAGVAKKQTFTLKSGNQGYCIGDVSG